MERTYLEVDCIYFENVAGDKATVTERIRLSDVLKAGLSGTRAITYGNERLAWSTSECG